jgi:hypothetical protein
MRQTLAILIDGYRELNHKRLFWITMALSGLFVLTFAAVGINERGITFLWFEFPVGGPIAFFKTELLSEEMFYKIVFVNLGLGIWLSWIATILALVSTASIIPDFVASGSVELGLSKPIGRTRLLLTKYGAGLLFAGLQVLVFTVACFFVIGLRAGSWEPGLFLAVPLVLLFFSYLYSISALVGLITRSSITALLVTLLCWFFFFMLNTADVVTLGIREEAQARLDRTKQGIERREKEATENLRRRKLDEQKDAAPGTAPPIPESFSAEELAQVDPFLASSREELKSEQSTVSGADRWQRYFMIAKTFTPKTSETIKLTERWIMSAAELKSLEDISNEQAAKAQERRRARRAEMRAEAKKETPAAAPAPGAVPAPDDDDEAPVAVDNQVEKILHGRSVWWVLGTSVVFESVILGIACVIFVRRDF